MPLKIITLAIAGGLMLTAAFPSPGVDLLAWVAFIPLLFALNGLAPAQSFRTGILFGMAHYASLLYWIIGTMHTYGNLPYYLCIPILLLFSFYLSLFTGVFAWLAAWMAVHARGRLYLLPVFWVALEQLRSVLLTGFPWGLAGHSQFERLSIIQISDVTGVAGISFLILLGNAAFFQLILCTSRKKWFGVQPSFPATAVLLLVFVTLAAGNFFYGRMRLDQVSHQSSAARHYAVRIVQGNISQAIKWDPAFQVASTRKYATLSAAGGSPPPDLVVWPETATPFYLGRNRPLTELVTQTVRKSRTAFLIGSPAYEKIGEKGHYYNSAFMLSASGHIRERYDKVHLVPFGEYVPLGNLFSFIGKMVEAVGDFSAGQKGKTLRFDQGALGVQICFEIIFPELSRSLAANGAEFLVNITNDAWFGKSSAPHQHFSIAVFRAIENRRALVRCANTGVSGFILPTGEAAEVSPLFVEKTLTRHIPAMQAQTPYTRYGDWLAYSCLFVGVAVVVYGAFRKKRFDRRP